MHAILIFFQSQHFDRCFTLQNLAEKIYAKIRKETMRTVLSPTGISQNYLPSAYLNRLNHSARPLHEVSLTLTSHCFVITA